MSITTLCTQGGGGRLLVNCVPMQEGMQYVPYLSIFLYVLTPDDGFLGTKCWGLVFVCFFFVSFGAVLVYAYHTTLKHRVYMIVRHNFKRLCIVIAMSEFVAIVT